MGKFIDLTGEKFGRLVVIDRAGDYTCPSGYRKIRWNCRCSCGNAVVVCGSELRRGDTISCGCYATESKKRRATTHGLSRTSLHSIWKGMNARCYNKNHKNYIDYGGRGITICDEWRDDFRKFYDWSIRHGYSEGLTIDRKNVDGSYCPDNCCWVTRAAQANNRRNNIKITYNGETHSLKQWAMRLNIKYSTLYYRIKNNWNIEKAFTQ